MGHQCRDLYVKSIAGSAATLSIICNQFILEPRTYGLTEGGYRAFYNPGGPGPEPFEGIRYTEPGPADLEPVIIAIDDPMRVSRSPQQ